MPSENKMLSGKLNKHEVEIIVNEFGRFLAERQPIIKDAGLLPYPKEVIKKALLLQQELIRNNANTIKMFLQPNKRNQIKKYIGTLDFCSVALAEYGDIEPEDKEAVSYFNSFSSIKQVPEDRKKEYVDLRVKYMSK